jgi:hypothetical protein
MSNASIENLPELEGLPIAAWDNDPRHLLLQRILAAPDFVRSPQLARFLLHICIATFEGREQNLSEQHIGVEVFGREPNYDSAADTIVRSHALRLRRRLEQYFQRAGQQETMHLVVPRGGYVPLFLPSADPVVVSSQLDPYVVAGSDSARPDIEETHPANNDEAPNLLTTTGRLSVRSAGRESEVPPGIFARSLLGYRIAIASLALLCVGLVGILALHLRTHLPIKRNHLLWSRLFTEDEPTQIVLGDSGLVLFHAVTRQYVSLHDYLSDDVSKQMPHVIHTDPAFAQFLLHRRYTSMVDAATLTHLLRLPEAVPDRTLVHYSRDMHLNDFKTGNIIMIGAQEAVPWVELFENHMDFRFSIDNADSHASFINSQPGLGEATEYNSVSTLTKGKVYSVVAFLPNLSGNGNVLILEGLSMAGTEAAVDLIIDDDRLLPILSKARRPDGSIHHFEMLLESEGLGEGAGPARVVAMHTHD